MGRLTGTQIVGTGGQLFLAQAKAAGIRHLFCNPGSLEAAILDALVEEPAIQLVMGLHEGIVIAMADGYFKASGETPLVNVHAMAGTGQMAGQMFNAWRDSSPLVVTAGLADNEQYSDYVGLGASPGFSQKELNRQFTKTSWEIRNPQAIPLALRRAFKVSATAPTGPTYTAFADYALTAKAIPATIYPRDQFVIRHTSRPDPDAIATLADWLTHCRRPVFFVGDEVWRSGAQRELLDLAEATGASVTEGSSTHRNFPSHHPQRNAGSSGGTLPEPDLFLAIGAKATSWGPRGGDPAWPPVDRTVAIGLDTDPMGRTYPLDLAIVADVRIALTALLEALGTGRGRDLLAGPRAARLEAFAALARARQEKAAATLQEHFGRSPIHPLRLGYEIEEALEGGTIVLNEQFTADLSPVSFGFRPGQREKVWMGTSGASLGWGLGAAIGAKLAAPATPVVLNIGDGSVMYSAAAFWTMARYRVPVTTVVWNNRNYQTVRAALCRLDGDAKRQNRFPGMYLGEPDIDFPLLARSQGVPGEQVTAPDQIAAALRRGLDAQARGEPYVVEVVIARVGDGAGSTWH